MLGFVILKLQQGPQMESTQQTTPTVPYCVVVNALIVSELQVSWSYIVNIKQTNTTKTIKFFGVVF